MCIHRIIKNVLKKNVNMKKLIHTNNIESNSCIRLTGSLLKNSVLNSSIYPFVQISKNEISPILFGSMIHNAKGKPLQTNKEHTIALFMM